MRRRGLILAFALLLTGCGPRGGATTILNGRVTDASYRPIPGATVQVLASTWFGVLSEPIGSVAFAPEGDGFFQVSGLPAGQFRAIASAPGYVAQEQAVQMRPPEPFTVEFRLAPAGAP